MTRKHAAEAGKDDMRPEKDSANVSSTAQFHSAELSVEGLCLNYQFRLWNLASKPMCLLIKDDSDIMPWLNKGDVRPVKYYSADSSCPPTCLETQISDISKDEQGRFKGHYLVRLEILDRHGTSPGR